MAQNTNAPWRQPIVETKSKTPLVNSPLRSSANGFKQTSMGYYSNDFNGGYPGVPGTEAVYQTKYGNDANSAIPLRATNVQTPVPPSSALPAYNYITPNVPYAYNPMESVPSVIREGIAKIAAIRATPPPVTKTPLAPAVPPTGANAPATGATGGTSSRAEGLRRAFHPEEFTSTKSTSPSKTPLAPKSKGSNYDNMSKSPEYVKTAQQMLIDAGYDLGKGRADGKWGANTEAAHKQYIADIASSTKMNNRPTALKAKVTEGTNETRKNFTAKAETKPTLATKKEAPKQQLAKKKKGGTINTDISTILLKWKK